MSELRLLSYNLHGLRDDRHAIAEVIRGCKPDVVCVQEAPRFLRWRSKRAAIARESGLAVATADRPGGLMLMTSLRVKVVSPQFSLLPKSPRLHQRAVCSAFVELGGERWLVASVHMSLDDDERFAHLAALRAALPSYDGPVVLAGDINETPDGRVWGSLTEDWTDAWAKSGSGSGNTFSAQQPHKRIDAIFTSNDVEVVSCRAVEEIAAVTRASDHLPVLVDLRYARR